MGSDLIVSVDVILGASAQPALRDVDALAQLCLWAQRHGCVLRLHADPPAKTTLLELAKLTGLGELLDWLSGDAQRKPEPSEDSGAQEVVNVRDAPA